MFFIGFSTNNYFITFYIMKKLSFVFAVVLAFVLVGCGSAPMTDADMAAKYGYSVEEFQEQKEAAARMNMSVEDHLKQGSMDMGANSMDMGGMDHSKMGN